MNREFIEYLIAKRLELEIELEGRKGIPTNSSDPRSGEKELLIIKSLKARIELIENIENKYWSPYE